MMMMQYLPKPKWFCVDKEMLQKYQYELDQQLGSIPLNEFMCNHTHENYKCQIQLLHDHLIHSCMLAAECTIPFTKPDTKHHRNKAGWNEHVSKEFDHALHWHRLYLVVVVDLPLLRVAVEGSDNPVSLKKPCQASLPPDQQGRHSLGRQPEV